MPITAEKFAVEYLARSYILAAVGNAPSSEIPLRDPPVLL